MTTTEALSGVQAVILDYLRRDDWEPGDRFRMSEMGLCPRARVLKRLGVPRLKEPNDFDRWRFQMAHVIHDWLQRTLNGAEILIDCETEVGDEDFVGHYDGALLLPNDKLAIVEMKTMGPFFYNRLVSMERPISENHIIRRYIRQLMTYCLFAGVDEGRLLIVRMSLEDNKNGRQYPPVMESAYSLAAWQAEITAEIEPLRTAWRDQEIPDCTCADGDGWWVSRCDYYSAETKKCCQIGGN